MNGLSLQLQQALKQDALADTSPEEELARFV